MTGACVFAIEAPRKLYSALRISVYMKANCRVSCQEAGICQWNTGLTGRGQRPGRHGSTCPEKVRGRTPDKTGEFFGNPPDVEQVCVPNDGHCGRPGHLLKQDDRRFPEYLRKPTSTQSRTPEWWSTSGAEGCPPGTNAGTPTTLTLTAVGTVNALTHGLGAPWGRLR